MILQKSSLGRHFTVAVSVMHRMDGPPARHRKRPGSIDPTSVAGFGVRSPLMPSGDGQAVRQEMSARQRGLSQVSACDGHGACWIIIVELTCQ